MTDTQLRSPRPSSTDAQGARDAAPPSLHATGYRADIDGLRAIAVLLVVAYHAGWSAMAGGYVGVDVFFVLSGFLITGLLLREIDRTGTVSLREFYARRARRLLPLSTLVLVTTAACGYWLMSPLARIELFADVRASALYVANWRFSQLATAYSEIDVSATPLVHFWSLAIEEQFYVLWPLLIITAIHVSARRSSDVRRVLMVLLGVVVVGSLAASILLTPRIGAAAYYVTHTRLWELGAGGGLALLIPRMGRLPRPVAETAGAIGLAAVLAAALLYDAGTAFPGTAALLPVIGTMLLVVAGTQPDTGLSRLLALRPLPNLGRWSYAWYLWHWPALGLLALAAERYEWPLSPTTVVLTAVLGSLLLAGATHHLVETPLRHARSLRLPRRSIALGLGFTLVPVVAVSAYLFYGDVGTEVVDTTARVSVDDTPAGAAGNDAAGNMWAQFDPPSNPMSPAAAAQDTPTSDLECGDTVDGFTAIRSCVFGDPTGERTVLLVGDSHAAHWLPAISEIGERRSWRVLLATKGSCAITDVPISDDGSTREFDDCSAFREDLFDEMAEIDDLHLVFSSRVAHVADRVLTGEGEVIDDPYELFTTWRLGSERTFERMLESAGHVIHLRDTPGAPSDVPNCLSGNRGRPEECAFELAGTAHADAVLYAAEAVAAGDRVHLLDLTSLVCESDPCRVVTADGTIKFRDSSHLTSQFARQLARRVDALLPAAVHHDG